MARTRQIKMGFFLNEELAAVPPLGRLLFAGLWTIADRAGRLEDRPAKLRAAVLPYDRADGEKLIAQLAERGFLVRYEVEGKRYLEIVHFREHQRPHPQEPASEIPAPFESKSRDPIVTSHVERERLHGDTGTDRALPSLISSPSLPSHSEIDIPRERYELPSGIPKHTPEERQRLVAMHRAWFERTGKSQPDTWAGLALIQRGATEKDIDRAITAAFGKGWAYFVKCLTTQVEEREAGNDPDERVAGGPRTAGGQPHGRASGARGVASGSNGRGPTAERSEYADDF